MPKTATRLLLPLLLLVLSACADAQPAPTPTPSTGDAAAGTAAPAATLAASERVSSGILISEILVGVPGNNNVEFVELYNAGGTAVSLAGYTLWSGSQPGQAEPLMAWQEAAVIPPYGHYLLVRAGQDVGQAADATFVTALAASRGGLWLEDAAGTVLDRVGWGAAPPEAVAGSPAVMPDGGSLERLPGGAAGSAQQTHDNGADFVANAAPQPQNSGSPMTPLPANRLDISLSAPAELPPGQPFSYEVRVSNPMAAAAANGVAAVPLPAYFSLTAAPDGAELADGLLSWPLPELAAGETAVFRIELTSPFTYVDTRVSGYYAEADGLVRSYGAPQLVVMAGGAIPIATARQLLGSVVSVEGIATMYTGGFFAGSTGVKFYMEDDSGGIQVYVPGGAGQVAVAIGDRLRVTGVIEAYRDSLELIPTAIPDDVEKLGQAAPPEPLPITVEDVASSDAILGRLTVVEGLVTRIEEFNFSYEVDLTDEQGGTALVLIEKDTGATAESLDLGQQLRVTGISEFYSGFRQVKPRVQDDLKQVFPPVVRLELQAPNSVQAGQRITYTVTASNYTTETLRDATLVLPLPRGVGDVRADAAATVAGGEIAWQIAELAAGGGAFSAQVSAGVPAGRTGSIEAEPARLSAAGLPAKLASNPFLTFIGDGVPIWAIQGPADRSPYARDEATTSGIVTGVFPGLHGFFLQETNSDADPATSAGIFVLVGDPNADGGRLPVAPGDAVRLTGRVRELSGQTTLHLQSPDDLVILSQENALPAAAVVDPPTDTLAAAVYYETLEGMLVTLGETAVAVAPTTQYGETVLVYARWGVETVPRGAETGFFIVVDDGAQTTHAAQDTLPFALQVGDQVASLTGPLAYTFGQYKIEPVAPPTLLAADRPLPSLPPTVPNQLRIVTFNVENFFDRRQPHPSSPPLPSRAEYERKLEKLAEAIVRLGTPAIIGLQEVENLDVLQDLVSLPILAPYRYDPYLIDGPDSRGIDVAYLVRGQSVAVAGIGAYADEAGVIARPTLALTATVAAPSGPLTLIVLNNHFTSLSGGEAATEPRRTAQAAWNVALMARLQAHNPDALFVVLGDLNSFYGTPPLQTLQAAGLRHAYEALPAERRPYTYIFEGATQTLDHILLSERLFAQVTAVEALHINASYPIAGADDYTARRVSDHDPLAVTLTLE